VVLVERIVLGESLEQVTNRLLADKLGGCRTTGEAAEILLEAVVTACAETASSALAACEARAAADDDLPSLASASRALAGLCAYGSSRALSSLGDDALVPLCQKTFDRAVLRAPSACIGTDEAVGPVLAGLRTLHEVALSQPAVDKEAWLRAARELTASYGVNPTASGLACALLHLAHAIDDAEVARVVQQRLSSTLEPLAAASFLGGFLAAATLVLVKSRPVVEALDRFLNALDVERFKDVLPVLRRGFTGLGPTERRYLMENLLALRGLGAKAGAAQALVAEQDKEKLKDMSAELAKAMDDLDDLL
jgi:hypothetical protein